MVTSEALSEGRLSLSPFLQDIFFVSANGRSEEAETCLQPLKEKKKSCKPHSSSLLQVEMASKVWAILFGWDGNKGLVPERGRKVKQGVTWTAGGRCRDKQRS